MQKAKSIKKKFNKFVSVKIFNVLNYETQYIKLEDKLKAEIVKKFCNTFNRFKN